MGDNSKAEVGIPYGSRVFESFGRMNFLASSTLLLLTLISFDLAWYLKLVFEISSLKV